MPVRETGKVLKCCICGKWNLGIDIVELQNDSSCISMFGKRVMVPSGLNVCLSHRPYQFLPEKQDKAS